MTCERNDGRALLACDTCDELSEPVVGERRDAEAGAARAGWLTQGWTHQCPTCVRAAEPTFHARIFVGPEPESGSAAHALYVAALIACLAFFTGCASILTTSAPPAACPVSTTSAPSRPLYDANGRPIYTEPGWPEERDDASRSDVGRKGPVRVGMVDAAPLRPCGVALGNGSTIATTLGEEVVVARVVEGSPPGGVVPRVPAVKAILAARGLP